MEVERYTLATGETVLTGFNRFWRHWGLLFAVMGYFANLWPGWAISSATLTSYLVGGNPTTIGVVTLLIIGLSLTFAPVVYVALERLIFVKVAAVLVLVVLATAFATGRSRGRRCRRDSRISGACRQGSGSRSSSARLRSPGRAGPRISVRATGFATKASRWGSTCRVSSAR